MSLIRFSYCDSGITWNPEQPDKLCVLRTLSRVLPTEDLERSLREVNESTRRRHKHNLAAFQGMHDFRNFGVTTFDKPFWRFMSSKGYRRTDLRLTPVSLKSRKIRRLLDSKRDVILSVARENPTDPSSKDFHFMLSREGVILDVVDPNELDWCVLMYWTKDPRKGALE